MEVEIRFCISTSILTLDPQYISGSWIFLNNETELRLIYQGDTVIYNMIDLNEELLKMEYSARDSSNILHTFSAGFERL